MNQIKNTIQNYGSLTKILHWLVGMFIICLLCVGFYMVDMEKSDLKFQIYGMHKALRFIWRMINIQPKFLLAKWEHFLSRANFIILYFLMFAMPLSGISMSLFGGRDIDLFGFFTIKATMNPDKDLSKIFWQAHGIFAYILIICIGLHISASLYHQFIKKDDLLKKIL